MHYTFITIIILSSMVACGSEKQKTPTEKNITKINQQITEPPHFPLVDIFSNLKD